MTPRSFSGAGALLLCALLAACRTPEPPPAVSFPDVEILGVRTPVMVAADGQPVECAGPLPPRLDAATVVARALAESQDLAAAVARVREAEAEARQARLLPNPLLSVTFRLAEGGASPGLDLGLAQDLVALLARPDRAGAADARLRGAVEQVMTTALDVAADAASRAVAVRAADDRLPLLAGRADVLARLRDAARARVESGEGRPLDVTTAEEEIVAAELDLAEARAESRADRTALARMLGRPDEVTGWTVDWPDAGPATGTEREWIAAAAERRPEIRAADWEIAALEADAALAGLARSEGAEAGIEAEGTKDWSAGPSISVPSPLFDDGAARRDVALARIAGARHRREALRRRAADEVRSAWNDLRHAADVRRLAEERLVPLAERRRAEAEAVYRAGEADLADVLLAEDALRAARLRAAEGRARAAEARIRLQRAAGGGAPVTPSPAPNAAEGGRPDVR